MKTTTVPAQVTTIEDKIAGNLNLSQLMLLCAPIFLSAVGYVLVPPLAKFTYAKLAIFIALVFIFSTLSIRLRGKLIVQWIAVIGRYNLRPRYYIYNKNDPYLRPVKTAVKQSSKKKLVEKTKKVQPHLPKLPVPQLIKLQDVITDPRSKLSLRVGRKGLDVRITEIK